ncbi:MAG: ATP-binding cassette domain-containing protein [Phycisphaeraceae bacterium]
MTVSSSSDLHDASTDHRWPVIDVPDGETVVGRSGQCQVVLVHASISRRHARLLRQSGQVAIEDLDSRFGTFVNASQIRRRTLEAGDVVRLGNSPPYRFDGQRLVPDQARTGMALAFEDVGIRGDQGQWLLSGVSVRIEPGKFVGVLGPSGAGKSLLLESLGTLRTPDAGAIRFDGDRDLGEHMHAYREQLGQVPQDDLVYPWLTVRENIEQAADIRLATTPRQQRHRRAREALDHVDLAEHLDKPTAKLSGGQRKRLSVAIELLREPRLLLLDEPTSGLDPGLQGRVMDLLRSLARRGMTVVCSTHTLDTANYSDRVIVVGKHNGVGTVAWTGPPDELLDAFDVRHAGDLYERL